MKRFYNTEAQDAKGRFGLPHGGRDSQRGYIRQVATAPRRSVDSRRIRKSANPSVSLRQVLAGVGLLFLRSTPPGMFAYTERIMTRNTHAAMSVLLCLQLLAPGIPAAASDDASHCKKDCPDNDFKKTTGPVTLEVGQPSVWSLAQAHYLLTEMHKANRKLATQMPTMDQLDPNRANASRLDILRTLLQVDAGFDQSVALKNQVELQHFREKEQAKVQAQIQVQQRQATLQQLDQDLLDLNQQIAVLTVQDGLSDKARGSAPPSEADRQRKEKIASLTVQRDAKAAQRTALQAEIDNLNKTATADVATPTVNAGTPPTSTSAPGS